MNEKKSIAFYGIKYFPSKGGTSRVAENLIQHLAKEYHITIYCYTNADAKTHIDGVEVVEFPEIKWGSLGVFLYYLRCYWDIRFKRSFDIVHAHKIDSFFFLKGLAKKARVIATAHEAPYKRDKWSGIAKTFFRYCEKRFLSFDGEKTAISKPLCEFYREHHGVEVQFIPNGINLNEETFEGSLASFWPKELPANANFVLFAARRIMGTKGLHTMLQAYKKIGFTGNIFVAGELDNYPAYIKKVKEIGKGLNVFFLGYVSPLPALLALVSKCDYFVFPSETEGMSIMLLEVASSGKPIVASDIPENTQVFDGNDVLFFRNKDVDDLAEKLEWAADHPALFNALGAHARDTVTTKYTWDRISDEYIALYEHASQNL